MRVTVACPIQLAPAANQLAMCLAYGPADALTFAHPLYSDAEGNEYACASWETQVYGLDVLALPISRPDWDAKKKTIDMDAAWLAQSLVTLWTGEGDIPAANPEGLVAVVGIDGDRAVAAMGLTIAEIVP